VYVPKVVSVSSHQALTTVCMIPKTLIISHQTSSLTHHIVLPDECTAATVTLHLAACLLHEIRLGVDSSFWPALQMLPRETIRVPTFWGHEDLGGQDGAEGLAWLKGTAAELELDRKDQEGLSFVRAGFRPHHAVLGGWLTSRWPPHMQYM
jgi:hypothetical protein